MLVQHFMGTQFKITLFFLFFYSVLSQQISNLEHKALLDLRSSLGIRARNWPRKSDPCTNWTGIHCNNGKVMAIKLTGLRRSHKGNLSPQFAVDSLANFAHLTSFNSSGFALPGPIPDWFGQKLTQLKQLDLSSSSILGSLPTSFGSLSNLDFLSLFNNSITGTVPLEIGKLSSLRVLDLSWNSLTGSIPSSFSDIKNMSVLDLSSNFLSGQIPVEFGSFLGLKYLNLSNNSLSSYIPNEISNLSELVELDLGYNYLSGSLPEDLSRMRNLSKLLVGNNELEGALPSSLFTSNVSVLEYIDLSWNRFEGEIPDVLWSLSHLRILDISRNNFTGVVSNSTYFSATGASYNLSSNLFYGNVTFDVRSFQSIDLSNNYFQGLAPDKPGVRVMDNCFTRSLNQRSLDDCSKFYADRGLVFVDGRIQTPVQRASKGGHKRLFIMVGVFGGVGVLLLLALVILLSWKICYRGNSNERGISNVSPVVEGGNNQAPVKFSRDTSGSIESFAYDQILKATSNFNETNLIKNGHTGDIFRGILEGGVTVVIKKVNVHHIEKETYKLELDLLNWTTHHRLVPFLGHCLDHENEKFLIYKYMPNGDLFNLLSRDTDLEDENGQSLDWITRLKIATGAAEALVYLHHECNPPLVHRDVQASSILLDDKFEVRLGSLTDVCAQEGDSQNLITKFFRSTKNPEGEPAGSSFTSCSTYDVYCFGKVLLELVTGKVGVNHSDDASTKEWLDKLLPFITIREKELLSKIVDPSLIIDDDLLEEMWAVAIVAKACLHPRPSRRPEMRRVLKALENPFKVVREGSFNSIRLRNPSSRQSWSAAFLGSWNHNSQDSINASGQTSKEAGMNLKQSGRVGSHSISSGNEHSSSCKRSSSEIFPEPQETLDIERQDMS